MVKVRAYRGDESGKLWEVDISFDWPETGAAYRGRFKSPCKTEKASIEWGEKKFAGLLARGPARPKPAAAPTLKAFAPRFDREYQLAGDLKPSTREQRDLFFRVYLFPNLGETRVDAIGPAEYAKLGAALAERGLSPRTRNGVLSFLALVLRVAHRWGVRGPVEPPRLARADPPEVHPYEPDELRRLLEGAQAVEHQVYVVCLLGADAGLRAGEIAALGRADIDLVAGLLEVRHGLSAGALSTPKTRRSRRTVPLTARLKEALRVQLKTHAGGRVLAGKAGAPFDRRDVAYQVARAERKAGLRSAGDNPLAAPHRLRHTFGTRLAAEGATAKEIGELMGHASIRETEVYLHLAKAHRGRAIALLDRVNG